MTRESSPRVFRSVEDVLREFFPAEYERRVSEGRCLHCGEKHRPGPFERKLA